MANYPTALDDASSLYSPADAFSTKPLDTTATQQILAGDSTVSVASTDGLPSTTSLTSSTESSKSSSSDGWTATATRSYGSSITPRSANLLPA